MALLADGQDTAVRGHDFPQGSCVFSPCPAYQPIDPAPLLQRQPVITVAEEEYVGPSENFV